MEFKKLIPRMLFPFCMAACLILATLYVQNNIKQSQLQYAQELFEVRQEKITERVSDAVKDYTQIILSGAALFEVYGAINDEQWREYVERLRLDSNFSEVKTLGYAPYISRNRDSVQVPALYLEPRNAATQSIQDMDFWKYEDTRQVISIAIDSGKMAMSDSLVLQKNINYPDDTKKFIVFFPHYKAGADTSSIQSRRENISGFIFGVFETQKVLNSRLLDALNDKQIDLLVYDGGRPSLRNLIYKSHYENHTRNGEYYIDKMKDVATLKFNNHEWTVLYETRPAFGQKSIDKRLQNIVLWGGLVISVLTFFMLLSLHTARLQAEEIAQERTKEYEETQERLNLTIHAAKAGIYDWDMKNDIMYWSDLVLDMLGIKKTNAVFKSRDFFNRVHPEDLSRLRAHISDHLENNSEYKIEYRLKREDGTYVWVDARGQAIWENGTPVRMAGTMVDVSNSIFLNNNLDAIEKIMNIGTWRLNLITQKILWSDQTFVIHGIPLVDGEPDLEEAIGFYIPKHRKYVEDAVNMSVEKGVGFNFEATILGKDGVKRDVRSVGYCEKDDKGKTVAIWGTFQDITEEKKAEAELAQYRENLEKLVHEQTKDIVAEKENAERANRIKDDFLANMSHELRTPLNSIMGLTGLMLKLDNMPEDHKHSLNIVYKSSDSLLNIVNDILDLSKIEAGHFKIENAPMPLNKTLEGTIEQLRPLAVEKGLKLNKQISVPDDLNVIGDALRLSRSLVNILSNAIKYTDNGSVDVTIHLDDIDKDRVMLSAIIKDTGIGISEDMQEHIFEKFTQTEAATHKRFSGTGLGLNITKQLVEMMGGRIKVESQVGEGSEFTINIPLDVTQDLIQHELSENGVNEGTNKNRKPFTKAKILVAEDHEFNKIFIKKLLKKFDCDDFDIVENGVHVLSAIDNKNYDMILMDCHMPEMNGYEATKNIRKNGNDIPIIAMTADAMVGTKEACLEIGMNDYISKPIDSGVLKSVLSRWFIMEEA